MLSKVVFVLIFISLFSVKGSPATTQQIKCGICYSKASSEFLSCIKNYCKTEILNKYTLFRVDPQSIKQNECNSCYSKDGTAFNSCVKGACSSLLIDKAIEVAVKNPFKLGRIAPIETTSCKVCLSQVANSEQVSACYYLACKEELSKSALKEQSDLTGSNCGICSIYDNDEFKNCAIMFCKAESKSVLLKLYGEVIPSNKLCADLCYQRTLNSGSNFFDCSKELCGASTDIMQLFNQMQMVEGFNCDTCYYLFSGVSLKSCQEQYCESELSASFEGKAKLFSVEPSYKSACSACNLQFKGDALALCVIQECKKNFEIVLYDNEDIKLSRCHNFCTYSYYDGYFTYNEWYDCYYYNCKEEVIGVYSQQLAAKQSLSVYCTACYQKYQTYGYEELDFECAYCHQSSLLDKRNLFGNLLDRNDKCGKCASEEGSFYLMCVNANCGSLLLKTSRDLALYEPTKLSGYICRDCSTVYEFGGTVVGKDCWWYACKEEKVDKTLLMAQENLSTSCKACKQFDDEVFNNCANWYCRKEIDSNIERLSKEKCTAYFFELNHQNKNDFIKAVTSNCLITDDEANYFLISKIKFDTSSWSDLACFSHCTDTECKFCKEQQLKSIAEKLNVEVSQLSSCGVCLTMKDQESAKTCIGLVPACKIPSAFPIKTQLFKKFNDVLDLCVSCSTLYDQSLFTFLELSNCQKQYCKSGVSSDTVNLSKDIIITNNLSKSISQIQSSKEPSSCELCTNLYSYNEISFAEFSTCSKVYCKENSYIELTNTGCNSCSSNDSAGYLNNYEYGFCLGYFGCKYLPDFSKLIIDTRTETFQETSERSELESSKKLTACSDCLKYWISGAYTDYQYGYCQGYYYCKAINIETQLRNKYELVTETDLCSGCCTCNNMYYKGYITYDEVDLCLTLNSCKSENKILSIPRLIEDYCKKCWESYPGELTQEEYQECVNFYCKSEMIELSSVLYTNTESSICSECNNIKPVELDYNCINRLCKNEVIHKFMLNQMAVKNNDGVILNHCGRCGLLYSEGYYRDFEYSICSNWYCREEIMQEAKIYFQSMNQDLSSNDHDFVTIGGIAVFTCLIIGLIYFIIKRKREEDVATYFSYKPIL